MWEDPDKPRKTKGARVRSGTKDLFREIRDAKFAESKQCYWCGLDLAKIGNGSEPLDASGDHLIPLDRGGKVIPENVVISCHPCNQAKRNKLVVEMLIPFMRRIRGIVSQLKNPTVDEVIRVANDRGYQVGVGYVTEALRRIETGDPRGMIVSGQPWKGER